MATSEAQSKSLIFQAQYLVADKLNACPDLSATPFWPEDLLDIEFQIHDDLAKQGIACTVMTPLLQYQGKCGQSTAWDFANLQLVIVENPQINRARENAMTALDIAYVAQEWLAGPKSQTAGMFVPVTIRQGEDGKLVVVTVELKALLHDDGQTPVVPAKNTVAYFVDGTMNEFSISGELKAGDIPNVETDLSALDVGTDVTSIGDEAFTGAHNFTTVNLPNGLSSIGNRGFAWCGLKSINMPDTVQSIGSSAFEYCQQMKTADLGNGVKTLGNYVFDTCAGLESVVLPQTLQSIGFGAFDICPNLSSVYFKGKTIEQVQAMDNYPWGADPSVIKVI